MVSNGKPRATEMVLLVPDAITVRCFLRGCWRTTGGALSSGAAGGPRPLVVAFAAAMSFFVEGFRSVGMLRGQLYVEAGSFVLVVVSLQSQ